MTVLNKLAYFRLVQAIGVDVIVSPRLAAVGSILQYLRRGKVLSVTPVREEEAEVIEVIALETSDLTNRPLREIRFPDGAIVGAVWSNERIIVPDGNTIIHPGDRVIIFALTSAVPKVEKLLTVKLGYF
jgi:trk system potassium uptake protein TrkA